MGRHRRAGALRTRHHRPTLTVAGLPTPLPETGVTTRDWQTLTAPIDGPLETDSTTTAGADPVVLGLSSVTVRMGLGYAGEPRPALTTPRTCTPKADAPDLAVIENTGGEPQQPVARDFGVSGTATLRTGLRGTAQLTGALEGVAPDVTSGAVSADLSLNRTTANLTAYGWLPVRAQIDLVPTSKATGALQGTNLALTTNLQVKFPKVTLFGMELGGGATCQSKMVSELKLASTAPFTSASGGPVTGTFAIGDLTGCGALTGLLSGLAAGGGNAIALTLTPAA